MALYRTLNLCLFIFSLDKFTRDPCLGITWRIYEWYAAKYLDKCLIQSLVVAIMNDAGRQTKGHYFSRVQAFSAGKGLNETFFCRDILLLWTYFTVPFQFYNYCLCICFETCTVSRMLWTDGGGGTRILAPSWNVILRFISIFIIRSQQYFVIRCQKPFPPIRWHSVFVYYNKFLAFFRNICLHLRTSEIWPDLTFRPKWFQWHWNSTLCWQSSRLHQRVCG